MERISVCLVSSFSHLLSTLKVLKDCTGNAASLLMRSVNEGGFYFIMPDIKVLIPKQQPSLKKVS